MVSTPRTYTDHSVCMSVCMYGPPPPATLAFLDSFPIVTCSLHHKTVLGWPSMATDFLKAKKLTNKQ